jgi:hypothetical protein
MGKAPLFLCLVQIHSGLTLHLPRRIDMAAMPS